VAHTARACPLLANSANTEYNVLKYLPQLTLIEYICRVGEGLTDGGVTARQVAYKDAVESQVVNWMAKGYPMTVHIILLRYNMPYYLT